MNKSCVTVVLFYCICLLGFLLHVKAEQYETSENPNFSIRYNLTLVTGNGDKRGTGVPYSIVMTRPVGLAYSQKRNTIYLSEGNLMRKLDLTTGMTYIFANVENPGLLAFSPNETTLYVCFPLSNKVQRMDFLPNGTEIFSDFAGNGNSGNTGEGGLAINAQLNQPSGVAVDSNGDVYISDSGNGLIRKVSISSGIITKFAGTSQGFAGDGGLAKNAKLSNPRGLNFGPNGDLYIADSDNNVVRRINSSGIISTIAGDTTSGYSGDGGDAKLAKMKNPINVIVSKTNEVFISDADNNVIRKVSNGNISTIAGNELVGSGFSGDGGDSKNALISMVQGFVWINDELVFGDLVNSIRKISKSGIISSLTQKLPFTGDGVNVDLSFILYPKGICVNENTGDIIFSEAYGDTIRKIAKNRIITKIAGVGNANNSAGVENGQALSVALHMPSIIQCQPNGDVYVADYFSNLIRLVSTNGSITNVAGTGVSGYSGDGGNAKLAKLNAPNSVKVSSSDEIFIADTSNNVIRKVFKNGTIVTIAGTFGSQGYSGDNGLAIKAILSSPSDIALAPNGEVFIADWGNHVIRKIDTKGIITTIVGNGTEGNGGEGFNRPLTAQLTFPKSISLSKDGELFISDFNGIKKLTVKGTIAHIAGVGDDRYVPLTQNYLSDATTASVFTDQIHIMSNGDLIIGIGNGYDNGKIYKLSKLTCTQPNYSPDSTNTFCLPSCFGLIADSNNICSGNGSCISTNTCQCKPGYTGAQCQTRIEPTISKQPAGPLASSSSILPQKSKVVGGNSNPRGVASSVGIGMKISGILLILWVVLMFCF